VSRRSWSADIALDIQTDLGESPVWDHRAATLLFVDMHAGGVYAVIETGVATVRGLGRGVGAIALAGGSGYVLGTESGFALLDEQGGVSDIVDLGLHSGRRMNDCQVGPDGAFWEGRWRGRWATVPRSARSTGSTPTERRGS
jgi:sugar lactone lactonase YvrE